MDNQHSVSIIIPTLNEEEVIGRCLKAIKNLNTPRDRYEVIVVDNGSMDRTLEIVSSFKELLNIKVLEKPGVTISALRNIGVKHSKGDIVSG